MFSIIKDCFSIYLHFFWHYKISINLKQTLLLKQSEVNHLTESFMIGHESKQSGFISVVSLCDSRMQARREKYGGVCKVDWNVISHSET